MAQLRSLYSAEATANVPNDLLAPKPPVVEGNQQEITQDGGVTHGRSLFTIAWTAPTQNEDIGGEFLGTADGNAQNFETVYDPVVTGETVYEMSNFGGAGRGDSTLSVVANQGETQLTVADATDFNIGDWIQVVGGGNTEYFQITALPGGNVLEFATRILTPGGFPVTTTTVKEADAVAKTGGGTDYTITLSTGEVSIVAGQFTNGNEIVIAYTTTLQDLNGYTLLRNQTLLADTTYSNVSGDGGTTVVSDAIGSGATSFQETLTAAENGETWYYYLYAKDDEASPNRSFAATVLEIETIPSIPQNLQKTVGDQAVDLSWDSLGPGSSDANTDGYNVYRNSGGTLTPASLEQLNAILIPKAQLTFQDSQDGINSGDRVSAGTVPLPSNGQTYTYVIESEDTATNWTVGTQNQDSGQAAVTTATRTPA